MSDHNERACLRCGSLLHHEDDCATMTDPTPSTEALCGGNAVIRALAETAGQVALAARLRAERDAWARAADGLVGFDSQPRHLADAVAKLRAERDAALAKLAEVSEVVGVMLNVEQQPIRIAEVPRLRERLMTALSLAPSTALAERDARVRAEGARAMFVAVEGRLRHKLSDESGPVAAGLRYAAAEVSTMGDDATVNAVLREALAGRGGTVPG